MGTGSRTIPCCAPQCTTRFHYNVGGSEQQPTLGELLDDAAAGGWVIVGRDRPAQSQPFCPEHLGKVLQWYMLTDRTLVVKFLRPEGIAVVQQRWEQPPSADNVAAALNDGGVDIALGEKRVGSRRRLFGRFWLYVGRSQGPPLWKLPRVWVVPQRGRFDVGGGWWYRSYNVSVAREQRDT